MGANSQTLMAEIFPVKEDELPPLSSYVLDVSGGETSTMGGKLAYRLKRMFPGNWAWAGGKIVTDRPQDEEAIMEIVRTLWSEQPDIFRGLRGVIREQEWQPTTRTLADFVARGLLSGVRDEIQGALKKWTEDLGNAYVERVCDIRGWSVQGQPAISVSVSSRLLHKQDLATYVIQSGADDLEGLEVADKTSTLKGVIVDVVGPVSAERDRLLAITQREEMQEIIAKAPDDELVVKVSTGYGHPYDYVISALRIVLRTEYLRRFGVNPKRALAVMRLAPQQRADIVAQVSKIVQRQYVDRAYNSTKHKDFFMVAPYSTQVRVGSNKTVSYDKQILNKLQAHGLYRVVDKFSDGAPVRVGFINALGRVSFDEFWAQIERKLRALGFGVSKSGEVEVEGGSRTEIDKAITDLQAQDPDIVLAFFPDQFGDDEDEETAYYHFKSLTVSRGLPSQVVEQSTLGNRYAIDNIVMGVLGKTGNIPYVLAKPLDFADVIVGIDIARERKKSLAGSVNATALARIYLANGEFLQYVIHDAPIEGETIPSSVLQSLFPLKDFEGKQVVIHRDGYFRGKERQALRAWAKQIGATFHLVQVVKTGAPRVYAYQSDEIGQPKKGSAFLLSDTEALLISTLPPFENATPQPLRITADRPFTIEQALTSVLAMTVMHYGSVRPPRLPVTIHYSDRIAYMALRGIKPQSLVGDVPYWL